MCIIKRKKKRRKEQLRRERDSFYNAERGG